MYEKQQFPMHMDALRCVLVGDPCVGKTSLIVAYTKNGFCHRYQPTAFDNYSVTVNIDGLPMRLELNDTAGRSEFDKIRPLSYTDADVFLLCFSVAKANTLRSATQRWLPELRHIAPTTPVILVGTQSDLRYCSGSARDPLISQKTIDALTEQCGLEYMECSAVTQLNMKKVFDLAILYALRRGKRWPLQQQQPIAPTTVKSPKNKQKKKKQTKTTLKDSSNSSKGTVFVAAADELNRNNGSGTVSAKPHQKHVSLREKLLSLTRKLI